MEGAGGLRAVSAAAVNCGPVDASDLHDHEGGSATAVAGGFKPGNTCSRAVHRIVQPGAGAPDLLDNSESLLGLPHGAGGGEAAIGGDGSAAQLGSQQPPAHAFASNSPAGRIHQQVDSAPELEPLASQPAGVAGAADAAAEDDICMTQAVPAPQPQAAFGCTAGMAAGADDQFELTVAQGARVLLGRADVKPPTLAAGEAAAILTSHNNSHLGISRSHGHLEYNESKGVLLMPLQKEGFPTFLNGSLLTSESTIISDGDELGFGGTDPHRPSDDTVRYVASFRSMPQRVMAAPPSRAPRLQPTDGSQVDADAEIEGTATGGATDSVRVRGERGGKGRKRLRDDGSEAPPPPPCAHRLC